MNIIICLDDDNGMMFNKRRQSQDRILRADLKEFIKDKDLYMNNYSYKLYKDIDNGNIKVSENFLEQCTENDFCLVEDKLLNNYINKINNIIIYKWNRIYPSDLYFDINLTSNSWELLETKEFEGSSHEKITRIIYRRVN
ncbi:ribonuclease Z [uncultured Clostridium sp.]|uniref:ribonuclease Z n=1 Tax=uncultured Clostridium sp. TaxID=59620 RepID=UPI002670BD6E|nr:ribonuclease Z [uncultured Clostridium sp.]